MLHKITKQNSCNVLYVIIDLLYMDSFSELQWTRYVAGQEFGPLPGRTMYEVGNGRKVEQLPLNVVML